MAERLADYRHVREQIEREILPLATSVDGLSFEFQASLHDLALRRGGYVMLEADGAVGLGQITDVRVDSVEAAGQGVSGAASNVLIRLARGIGDDPRHQRTAVPRRTRPPGGGRSRSARGSPGLGRTAPASPSVSCCWRRECPATLDSGGLGPAHVHVWTVGIGQDVLARACCSSGCSPRRPCAWWSSTRTPTTSGSAGSGTTPTRSSAAAVRRACRTRSRSGGTTRLRTIRCDCASPTWTRAAQAAVLGPRPDPGPGRVRRPGRPPAPPASRASRWSRTSNSCSSSRHPAPVSWACGRRNLGVLDWRVWSPELPSLVDELRTPTARCTVVDLGLAGHRRRSNGSWPRPSWRRCGSTRPSRQPVSGGDRRGAQHLPGRPAGRRSAGCPPSRPSRSRPRDASTGSTC